MAITVVKVIVIPVLICSALYAILHQRSTFPAFLEPLISRLEGSEVAQDRSMAWRSSGATNAALITNLAANGLIKSERVKEAMLKVGTTMPCNGCADEVKVDRAHYSPYSPYYDSPQSIGWQVTISAPHMHASAAESLLPYLHPSARILDVGSGSGYLTHVLANLVGPQGRVVGIEHIPGLVELSRKNMAKSQEGRSMLETEKVKLIVGDGRKGWPEDGPYDAIHVGAAAKEAHNDLLEQLNSPGR